MARFAFNGRMGRALVLLIWGGLIVVAMGRLTQYQMQPSAYAAPAPTDWPNLKSIQRDPSRFTLVMTLHPQCPCSRASLHELAELMARAQDRVAARVIVVDLAGSPKDWLWGELWKQAAAIPGVVTAVDQNGKDSQLLNATTSGDVIVFNAAGRLVFQGGITDGRGHEGDNAGLSAILALVDGAKPATQQTPVYGCSLTGKNMMSFTDKAK
jgi:hypothetical protein